MVTKATLIALDGTDRKIWGVKLEAEDAPLLGTAVMVRKVGGATQQVRISRMVESGESTVSGRWWIFAIKSASRESSTGAV
jgi:hypothetical protein